ncbi:MAG: transcription antitermination factor NusB [Ruminococcaceae bacterium]|nr:transcription antitermination factor NusB [Oscillospiraceae bacterium]
MKRKEARENAMCLLFEQDFRENETPAEIYEISIDNKETEDDEYLRRVFFGVNEHMEKIDEVIGRHSKGWKTDRMSHISRAIQRIAVYEMMFEADIPAAVSINEAVELSKKYDDEKAKRFVNGVLNAVKDELSNE